MPKFHRHAAHEKARVVPRVLQNPGEHRRRRRLAVRARHREHPFVGEHMLTQPLRARRIGQVPIQDFFHERIAARDHVADDEQVGRERHLVGIEAFDQPDTLGLELGAHRRIDVGVAARDGMSGLTGEHGQTAHERAADAQNMNMHGWGA